jgi:nucleoside-diphosphate-sugar epimerase
VRGLVRTPEKADLLAKFGIEPVLGSLDDADLLAREARKADGVVNTANADHLPSARALVTALAGTGKPLVHTSGSSVIGDDARGNRAAEAIFDEDTAFVVAPAKQHRRDIDLLILGSSASGVRSAVICPTLIYGTGRGANPHSVQIPFLADNARRNGCVQVVGRGVNRWSNVHIDDLAELYLLVLEKAPAGGFYFAENGEVSFGEIGEAIAARLGLSPVQSLPAELAAEKWGESRAFYSFGSNSRVRAKRARRELGWAPRHASVISWILQEMPI